MHRSKHFEVARFELSLDLKLLPLDKRDKS